MPGYQRIASGVYDEIPEMPGDSSRAKARTGSTGSTSVSTSSTKPSPPPDRSTTDEDKRATKKNIADKVLRRRSFVKEKSNMVPKTSLGPMTSEGVVLVPSAEQHSENKRNSVDLSLPVNENKVSLLKIFKTLKRGSASTKPRGGCPLKDMKLR